MRKCALLAFVVFRRCIQFHVYQFQCNNYEFRICYFHNENIDPKVLNYEWTFHFSYSHIAYHTSPSFSSVSPRLQVHVINRNILVFKIDIKTREKKKMIARFTTIINDITAMRSWYSLTVHHARAGILHCSTMTMTM